MAVRCSNRNRHHPLILIGIPFLILFFIGLLPIIIGIVLIASGASARGDERRQLAQQQQTNQLLQQQMQLTAMQMNRETMPGQVPAQPPVRSSFPDSKQWVLPVLWGTSSSRSGVLPEMREADR